MSRIRRTAPTRLAALALAAIAIVGEAGEGWAASASDAIAKMQLNLSREPGSYVGCVPGACLRADMHRPAVSQIEHVPIHDVDGACQGNAICVQDEQDAYDRLTIRWDDLSIVDREVCFASVGGSVGDSEVRTSYRRMTMCVMARLEAAAVIDESIAKKFRP